MHPIVLYGFFLAALPQELTAMYSKKSPVLQVTGQTFDSLIRKSNHTSIVEFYAPWCGHCKSLKPAYEKAAQSLEGLAKVAAVDCDEETNKQFCGSMEVRGFPTLKLVRPSKKPGGRPVIEDYNGARTAKAIVEAVSDQVNNHVKRVTDKDLDSFLAQTGPKAVFFSDKGTPSVLLRSIAIDFLNIISFAQIRKSESESVARYKIESFPALILIPENSDNVVRYTEGDLKKRDIVAFLSQAGSPNPDYTGQADQSKMGSSPPKAQTSSVDSSKSGFASDAPSPKPDSKTTAEPLLALPVDEPGQLATVCSSNKAHICIILFTRDDSADSESSNPAIAAILKIARVQAQAQRRTFKFVATPATSTDAVDLISSLALATEVDVIAVNPKRAWWQQYTGHFEGLSFESWTESIRSGEGIKNSLPSEVVERWSSASASDNTRVPTDESRLSDTPQMSEEFQKRGKDSQYEHVEL